MLYCDKCGVKVVGNRSRCPLCGIPLSLHGTAAPEVFPCLTPDKEKRNLVLKLMIFISIAGAVICSAVNYLLPQTGIWAPFVVIGVVCMWVDVALSIRKLGNIYKSILWQAVILSILAVIWDLLTQWRGWSTDYAIPIIFGTAILSMSIIAQIQKLHVEDYLIYLLIDIVFGIIPIILLAVGLVNIPLPTIICVAISLIYLAALFVFEGKNILLEVRKRMHM